MNRWFQTLPRRPGQRNFKCASAGQLFRLVLVSLTEATSAIQAPEVHMLGDVEGLASAATMQDVPTKGPEHANPRRHQKLKINIGVTGNHMSIDESAQDAVRGLASNVQIDDRLGPSRKAEQREDPEQSQDTMGGTMPPPSSSGGNFLETHALVLVLCFGVNSILIVAFVLFAYSRQQEENTKGAQEQKKEQKEPKMTVTENTSKQSSCDNIEQVHNVEEQSTRSSDNAICTAEEVRLGSKLNMVEKIAVRVAGAVGLAAGIDKGGDTSLMGGFIAAVPNPDVDEEYDDSTSSRLRYWNDGFLGWWASENNFQLWCAQGEPSPLGKVPLLQITDARQNQKDSLLVSVVTQNPKAEEHIFKFMSEPRAMEWIGALSRLLAKLN